MPIEILSYSPNNVQQFVDFSINGVPDGQGGFETDERGRPKIGVLRWLHGRQVPRARFFSTPSDHPMRLLMSLIDRPEPEFVPWMGEIPGIEERIRIDGLIGEPNNFPLDNFLDAVVPNPELNDAFEAGRERVQFVLSRIRAEPSTFGIGEEDLIKALKDGTNVREVFAEVQTRLGITL